MIKKVFHFLKYYWVLFSGIWFYKARKLPVGTHLEYFLLYRVGTKIKTIIDVGANIGTFSKRLSQFFPDSEFYCFEPFGSTFERLQENLKPNKFHLIQRALGEKNEFIKVKVNEESRSDVNSLIDKNQPYGSKKEETLEVVTLDSFLLNNQILQIDLLKIDTEGFDLLVLKGANENLKTGKIKLIYVECGLNKQNLYHVYFSEIIDFLDANGFAFLGFFQTDLRKVSKRMHFSNALFAHNSVLEKIG